MKSSLTPKKSRTDIEGLPDYTARELRVMPEASGKSKAGNEIRHSGCVISRMLRSLSNNCYGVYPPLLTGLTPDS